MSVLLDTSVLLRVPGGHQRAVADHWAISVVTIGELEAGILLATEGSMRAQRLRHLAAVLEVSPVLAVDRAVAARYGELRAASGRVPSNDLWIAATALAHGMRLVTADRQQAALPVVATTLVG
ncbi:MAG TPA: PIN domain-containing protein [Solirubrobacteraceae bacterium]|nr:PIN domain-containing protein [Solirubrobacteraceae bacterium]